jgi:hypothetical protein
MVRIDEVEVDWPSGQVSHYRDVTADSAYLIREGAAQLFQLRPILKLSNQSSSESIQKH